MAGDFTADVELFLQRLIDLEDKTQANETVEKAVQDKHWWEWKRYSLQEGYLSVEIAKI